MGRHLSGQVGMRLVGPAWRDQGRACRHLSGELKVLSQGR